MSSHKINIKLISYIFDIKNEPDGSCVDRHSFLDIPLLL